MRPNGSGLISVIVPAYQAQATIGATITGLLTQTYPEVEIVVVDDGSTDATGAICRAYGPALRYVRQENAGTAAARNRAIELARGEFVALCDSDDVLLPSFLDAAMHAYRASRAPRRFVTCDAHLLTDAGLGHGRTVMYPPVPPPERQRLGILEANFVPGFVLAPREMFVELGGYDTATYLEDWDLWIRAVHAGWEVVAQTEPQALYRWRPDSKSTDAERVAAEEEALLQRVLEGRRDTLRPEEREYLERRLRLGSPRTLVREAETALRAGRYAEAARTMREASRLNSTNRRLALRARALRVRPAAWALRRRLGVIDASLGRDSPAAR